MFRLVKVAWSDAKNEDVMQSATRNAVPTVFVNNNQYVRGQCARSSKPHHLCTISVEYT